MTQIINTFEWSEMVTGQTIQNYPIDKAFSDFFGTPRWRYFRSDDNLDVVEFTGDCIYRDVTVKARIQFVVYEEEGTFKATYLAFNEVPQDMLTLSMLIEKAFEIDDKTEFVDEPALRSLSADDALEIAQQWLDDHPLHKRTITGTVSYEPNNFNMDTSGLYYIETITEYGDPRAIWVRKETGEVCLVADDILMTGEEYYDYVYRPELLTDDGVQTTFAYHREILYQGIPAIEYLNGSVDGIRRILETSVEDGVQNYEEIFFWVKDHEIENIFSWVPSEFSVNGATLDKDRDGIVAVLGNPIYERWDEGEGTDEYVMFYDFSEYRVIFSMWDPNDTVDRIYMDTLGHY